MLGNRFNFNPSNIDIASLLNKGQDEDIIKQLIAKQKENEALRLSQRLQPNEENPALNTEIKNVLPEPSFNQLKQPEMAINQQPTSIIDYIKQLTTTTQPNNEQEFIKNIGEAGNQKDLLGMIGSGLGSTLKYLNTTGGKKILSGMMNPQVGSILAQQAATEEENNRKHTQDLSDLGSKSILDYILAQGKGEIERKANEPKMALDIAKYGLEQEKVSQADKKMELQEKQFQEQMKKNDETLKLQWAKMNLDADKFQKTLEKLNNGKIIPAGTLTDISGTKASIDQIDTLKKSSDSLPDSLFEPGVAQIKSFNPFDKDAAAFNQLVASTKQTIGKGLEGGVLRKEDEVKYEKIIPKLGDTREILDAKYTQLRNLLQNKLKNDTETLKQGGYNIEGVIGSKQLTSQPIDNLSKEDKEAIAWAKKNINDPRAKKILNMNGVK